MKRLFAVAGVLGLLFVAAGVTAPPPANACSFTAGLPRGVLIDRATPVVAIGVVTKATDTVATFRVEEGIRGAKAGELLTINNALNLDCYTEIGGGPNYPIGARYLAFLEADTFGLAQWMPEKAGRDMYTIQGDQLTNPWHQEPSTPLDSALAELRALPADAKPAYHHERACELFEVQDFPTAIKGTAWATAVVRGEVRGTQDDVTEVRVTDSFKGQLAPGEVLRVDARRIGKSGICTIAYWSGFDRFLPGDDLILLLEPADAGVGDWRLAVWGSGVLAVSGTRVSTYPGMATLPQVREALGGQQALIAPVTGARLGGRLAASNASASRGWEPVVGVAGLAAAALLAFVARRSVDRRVRR